MSVINTNITSMIGQQNLSKSQNSLQTSMERLSSGLRINSAKDDAAGQAIANRMSAQITGLSTAQRNANDGISVAQTAEGALNQVNDNLQRVRELTVQAQNGTNSESDLGSIQDEINQRLNEINRISEQTDFNGVKVLSEGISSIAIQVGANDGESISVNLQTINQNKLGLDSFDITKTLSQVSAADDLYSSDGVRFTEADMTSEGTQKNLTDYDSAATAWSFTFNGTEIDDGTDFQVWEYGGEAYAVDTNNSKVYAIESDTYATNTVTVALGEDITGKVAVGEGDRGTSFNFDAGSTGVALDEFDISVVKDSDGARYARLVNEEGDASYRLLADEGKAQGDGSVKITLGAEVNNELDDVTLDPMHQLDDALKQVDSLRSELGAVQNRFETAITNLQTNETNLSAARSRIEDADYATEVANMTKSQILQQAGTSVLAQANQIPQNVLSLLG